MKTVELEKMSYNELLELSRQITSLRAARHRRAFEIFCNNLGLPIRVANALIRNGCFSIEDVCNLTKKELLSFKGIGRRSAEEIMTRLAEIGLKLREEENKPVDISGLTWN